MNRLLGKLSVGVLWLAGVAGAQAGPLVLHPQASPLPTAQQGPFVTTGGGGLLCIDSQNAWRSQDGGETWASSPIFSEPERFTVSNERALLRTRDGVVVAAWMNLKERAAPAWTDWGGSEETFRQFILPTYVCRSLDDGKTWEAPIQLNRTWCGCLHSLIETRTGRLVLVGQEIIYPGWRHATVIYVSDDKGLTWKRSHLLDIGVGSHDHAGSIEGSVIERKDGSLYLLLRTESGWLYEATSQDGGLTWGGFQQSGLKSVTCCPQMGRLLDGRIALLWNRPPRARPEDAHSREELSLAFSADECRTWTDPVVIAARYDVPGGAEPGNRRVSYPYLYEKSPGELWITTMQGNLRMRIQVADLSQDGIPLPKPVVAAAPSEGGLFMFGDSTTAVRPGAVSQVYAERLQEALVRMGSSLNVYNAGIGGNTTRAALGRLDRDVLSHHPKVVVVMFGINDAAVDVWKSPPASTPRVPLAEYETNLRTLVTKIREAKAKVILMTPNSLRWTPRLKEVYGKPPYQPRAEDGFDAPVLASYREVIRRLARELATGLVDVETAFLDYGRVPGQSVDDLLLDGMHPNDRGHALIADLLTPAIREQVR